MESRLRPPGAAAIPIGFVIAFAMTTTGVLAVCSGQAAKTIADRAAASHSDSERREDTAYE